MKITDIKGINVKKSGNQNLLLNISNTPKRKIFTLSVPLTKCNQIKIIKKARELDFSEIDILNKNHVKIDGVAIDIYNAKKLQVMDGFDASKVRNANFIGVNTIGRIDDLYHQTEDGLMVPIGICNATIENSIIGDNVAIEQARIANYIIEDKVTIYNVGQISVNQFKNAQFGAGVEIEIINENGGRSVRSFPGMKVTDAFLWGKFRGDSVLMQQFEKMTAKELEKTSTVMGRIAKGALIKNTAAIISANIGAYATVSEAGKIVNSTIFSSQEESTEVMSGSIIENSIIGYGSEVINNAIVNNSIVGDNTAIEHGVFLSDSIVGDNSTYGNGEIRNSLVYGNHQLHHGNAFLIATLIGGLSNSAEGSVIGSNHSSRQPDGEFVAGRGFWPGLNTSFKHSCRFASYVLVSKGDYQREMNVKLPFSLVFMDPSSPSGVSIRPAFWLMYNMYALARSDWKFADRDKRKVKRTNIVTNFLAPDTVEEMLAAVKILKDLSSDTGRYYLEDMVKAKKEENKVEVLRRDRSIETYEIYAKLYAVDGLKKKIGMVLNEGKIRKWGDLLKKLKTHSAKREWVNVGGQLIAMADLNVLFEDIKKKKIDSWDDLHKRYHELWKKYQEEDLWAHQAWVLEKSFEKKIDSITKEDIITYLNEAVAIKKTIAGDVRKSRAKDFDGTRTMNMDSPEEIKAVLGALKDDKFIKQTKADFGSYKKEVAALIKTIRDLR